jgi:alpha-N-arabinofuranosidase
VTLELDLTGFGKLRLLEHIQLNNTDLKAVNTAANPEKVNPSAGATKGMTVQLEKHSWNCIRYTVEAE